MLRSDNFDFAANCKGLNRTDAHCTFAAIKVVGNKNCRGVEDKNHRKPENEGQTEMETRTGHKENGNETGSLIASSDPSMLTTRLSP